MASVTVLEEPLAGISRRARPYPADLLPIGGTALSLFAAGYLGHNDAIHFARRDMTATCVDTDGRQLGKMMRLYPQGWTFVLSDAWTYAEQMAARGVQWDVVSVDTFTGDATARSLASLDLWCRLARETVTCTVTLDDDWSSPDGWSGYLFPRSERAAWLVLQRA